eukprot:gnl/Trimastix_PCT/2968.p1 GENE.gnl/Trimastix_PCT/2968~~gnl/Trimastix_PCT/2968.p1  ORF type:complete len:2220 (-),score=718.10 gnl/Trimastix_PCT/2968:78-6275(-)
MGFDVDSCAVGYDGQNVWALPRSQRALVTATNRIDLSRRSPTYEHRLAKYASRGFRVLVPSLNRVMVDPQVYERPMDKLHGLCKLLVLERLARPEQRQQYRMQQMFRRTSGTSPSTHERRGTFWHRIHSWLNYDPFLQDRLAESGVEASDYSVVFLPWGPKWNAARTQKIMYRKDMILNSPWYDPEKSIHTHPCFFGTMSEVIHDCCRACPAYPEDLNEDDFPFVRGELTWLVLNPGRQQIGSFHPITDGDWSEGAYLSQEADNLAAAANENNVAEIARILDLPGVSAETTDALGRTPLHIATMGGHLDACRLLLERGATLTFAMPDGRTALHLAVMYGHAALVRLFAEVGSQRFAMFRESAPEAAAPPPPAFAPGTLGPQKAAEAAGKNAPQAPWDIDMRSPTGYSALQLAVLFGHMDCVEAVLDAGADIAGYHASQEGKLGEFPALHIATLLNSPVELLQLLLRRGAPLHQIAPSRDTPLLLAVQHMRHDIVRCLLASCAPNDPGLRILNQQEQSVLTIALTNDDKELADLLLAHPACPVEVTAEDAARTEQLARQLRIAGPSRGGFGGCFGGGFGGVGRFYLQPLHIAVQRRDKELIATLLQRGADVNMLGINCSTAMDNCKQMLEQKKESLKLLKDQQESGEEASEVNPCAPVLAHLSRLQEYATMLRGALGAAAERSFESFELQACLEKTEAEIDSVRRSSLPQALQHHVRFLLHDKEHPDIDLFQQALNSLALEQHRSLNEDLLRLRGGARTKQTARLCFGGKAPRMISFGQQGIGGFFGHNCTDAPSRTLAEKIADLEKELGEWREIQAALSAAGAFCFVDLPLASLKSDQLRQHQKQRREQERHHGGFGSGRGKRRCLKISDEEDLEPALPEIGSFECREVGLVDDDMPRYRRLFEAILRDDLRTARELLGMGEGEEKDGMEVEEKKVVTADTVEIGTSCLVFVTAKQSQMSLFAVACKYGSLESVRLLLAAAALQYTPPDKTVSRYVPRISNLDLVASANLRPAWFLGANASSSGEYSAGGGSPIRSRTAPSQLLRTQIRVPAFTETNATDATQLPVLLWAIQQGNLPLVETLLSMVPLLEEVEKRGREINEQPTVRQQYCTQQALVQQAMRCGQWEMAQFLMEQPGLMELPPPLEAPEGDVPAQAGKAAPSGYTGLDVSGKKSNWSLEFHPRGSNAHCLSSGEECPPRLTMPFDLLQPTQQKANQLTQHIQTYRALIQLHAQAEAKHTEPLALSQADLEGFLQRLLSLRDNVLRGFEQGLDFLYTGPANAILAKLYHSRGDGAVAGPADTQRYFHLENENYQGMALLDHTVATKDPLLIKLVLERLRAAGEETLRRAMEHRVYEWSEVKPSRTMDTTPLLHQAVGSLPVTRLLLEYGADVSQTHHGKTVLHNAVTNSLSENLAEMLNLLREAALAKDPHCFSRMLRSKPSPFQALLAQVQSQLQSHGSAQEYIEGEKEAEYVALSLRDNVRAKELAEFMNSCVPDADQRGKRGKRGRVSQLEGYARQWIAAVQGIKFFIEHLGGTGGSDGALPEWMRMRDGEGCNAFHVMVQTGLPALLRWGLELLSTRDGAQPILLENHTGLTALDFLLCQMPGLFFSSSDSLRLRFRCLRTLRAAIRERGWARVLAKSETVAATTEEQMKQIAQDAAAMEVEEEEEEEDPWASFDCGAADPVEEGKEEEDEEKASPCDAAAKEPQGVSSSLKEGDAAVAASGADPHPSPSAASVQSPRQDRAEDKKIDTHAHTHTSLPVSTPATSPLAISTTSTSTSASSSVGATSATTSPLAGFPVLEDELCSYRSCPKHCALLFECVTKIGDALPPLLNPFPTQAGSDSLVPRWSFPLVKVNARKKKQNRVLRLTETSILNLSDKSRGIQNEKFFAEVHRLTWEDRQLVIHFKQPDSPPDTQPGYFPASRSTRADNGLRTYICSSTEDAQLIVSAILELFAADVRVGLGMHAHGFPLRKVNRRGTAQARTFKIATDSVLNLDGNRVQTETHVARFLSVKVDENEKNVVWFTVEGENRPRKNILPNAEQAQRMVAEILDKKQRFMIWQRRSL